MDFDLGVHIGQYTFPFSFLLPAAMPSSFTLSDKNYIKYTVTACLLKYDNQSSDQKFVRNLHIREPARGILTPLTKQKTN